MIRLTLKGAGQDTELLHALLNSSIALFFIESSGFGRGLGALDLSATKLRDGLRIVDPAKISAADRTSILDAYKPLLARDVKRLDEELVSEDRKDFDEAVLSAIGQAQNAARIRNAVSEIYRIRKAVKD